MRHDLIWFILAMLLFAGPPAPAQHTVNVVTINGVINPASSEFILKMIETAEADSLHCLVFQLDTPGGLVTSMREITKGIMASEVPVVVYVAPSGAHAASAGTFITLSAHVAAMAPGTNIGAASVVSMGMVQDSVQTTMMRKATNDAVAFIKSIAEQRGRNAEWAEKAVTEAASITASEALALNVVDFLAPSLDSLLIQLDGHRVMTTKDTLTLLTRQAKVHYLEMPLRYRILDKISDPNIAYLLFIIGFYGLLFELYNPGAVLPGIIGGICLILAFYAMNTLPVNYTGVLLIVLAIILFVLEVKIPSYGALTIGGIISLVLGSLMLYDTDMAFIRVSWEIIATVVVTTTLFFTFAIGLGIRAQARRPTIGKEQIVEGSGEVLDEFQDGEGQILFEGEIWQAKSSDVLNKHDRVRILKMEGLTLVVRKESMG